MELKKHLLEETSKASALEAAGIHHSLVPLKTLRHQVVEGCSHLISSLDKL
jgi:hypothetical protein